jgi:hypothetical protein
MKPIPAERVLVSGYDVALPALALTVRYGPSEQTH